MINKNTNLTKQVPVGFSWTTLFFGFWVAIYRSDWKWALLQALIAVFTSAVSWFIFPFIYNSLYEKELMSQGYVLYDPNLKSIEPKKANSNSSIQDLEKLSILLSQGLITREEFDKKKKELI